MPKGLNKATNYYNRLEAWRHWNALAAVYPELAEKYRPPSDSDWRTVDECSKQLFEDATHNDYQE